jgi:hypothetical protein
MQPLARETHSETEVLSCETVICFSMSVESPNSAQREDVSMKPAMGLGAKMEDEIVQAVKDDCDLLAVLGGKNVVEEGGFACAEVACSWRVSAAVMRFGGEIAHLSQW